MDISTTVEPIIITAPDTIQIDDISVILTAELKEGYESEVEVQWNSSDTEIAEIDENESITPKKAGEVIITATIGEYSESVIINIVE